MIQEFDIVFDRPNKVHFSGDNVTGHVLLKLDSSLPLRCVMIKFIGEAEYRVPKELIMSHNKKIVKKKSIIKKIHNNKVCPTTNDVLKKSKEEFGSTAKSNSTQREVAANKETYFDKGVYLFGHKYSSFRERLSSGTHKLPFDYTLPTSLPASFNGQFGYICYYCEAFIERWGAPLEKKRAYFSVSQIADINIEPKADMDYSTMKTTDCWLLCCPRGTIVVTSRLKRIGVVPGERVPFEIDIHNMSNRNIPETFTSIIQVTSYFSNHGALIYEDERLISVSKKGSILRGDFVIISDSLVVPPLPPTSFGHIACKIININYKLQVNVHFSRGNKSIIINMPLIVGNIPFKKDFNKFVMKKDLQKNNQIEMPNIFKMLPDFPAVWSGAADNPRQSNCTYNLLHQKYTPRYPFYKMRNQDANKSQNNSNDMIFSHNVLPPVEPV